MHGRSARTPNFLEISITEKYFKNGRIFWTRSFGSLSLINDGNFLRPVLFRSFTGMLIPVFPVYRFVIHFWYLLLLVLTSKWWKTKFQFSTFDFLDPTFISITWEEHLTPLDLGWPQMHSFHLYTYEKRLIFNWTEIQYENRRKKRFEKNENSQPKIVPSGTYAISTFQKLYNIFFRSQTNKHIKQ